MLVNENRCYHVLLFSVYNFLPRRPLHWSVDGDVRNTTITIQMARLQGTEINHGITGQKRQSGLVIDIWGGSFGMIASLPNIRNCSA